MLVRKSRKRHVEIVNLREHIPTNPYDFYIDRRSPVGNPFNMCSERERNEVCDKYQKYFESQIINMQGNFTEYLRDIREAYLVYGKVRLFCWCSPKRCHGQTIKNWLLEEVGK